MGKEKKKAKVEALPVAVEKKKGKEKTGGKRKSEQASSQPSAKKAKKEATSKASVITKKPPPKESLSSSESDSDEEVAPQVTTKPKKGVSQAKPSAATVPVVSPAKPVGKKTPAKSSSSSESDSSDEKETPAAKVTSKVTAKPKGPVGKVQKATKKTQAAKAASSSESDSDDEDDDVTPQVATKPKKGVSQAKPSAATVPVVSSAKPVGKKTPAKSSSSSESDSSDEEETPAAKVTSKVTAKPQGSVGKVQKATKKTQTSSSSESDSSDEEEAAAVKSTTKPTKSPNVKPAAGKLATPTAKQKLQAKAAKQVATKVQKPSKESSDEESSEEDESSEEAASTTKKTITKPTKQEESSSESDDSSDEEEAATVKSTSKATKSPNVKPAAGKLATPTAAKQKFQAKAAKQVATKVQKPNEESSDEESSEEGESSEEEPTSTTKKPATKPAKQEESESESDDSSDEETSPPQAKKRKTGKESKVANGQDDDKSEESSEEDESEEEEGTPLTKSPKQQQLSTPTQSDKACEVFVGQLPYSCEENDLKKFFKQNGVKPLDVTLPRDRQTMQPKGFAFVSFSNAMDVSKAIELNGSTMEGRQLRINRANDKPTPGSGRGGRSEGRGGRSDRGGFSNSTPSRTLFVNNLSYNTTEETLRKKFKSAQNVSLPTTEDGSSKGFGFIEFGDEKSAEAVLRKMNGTSLDGREIRLEFKKSSDRNSFDSRGRGRGRGRGGPRGRGGRGGSGSGGFNKSRGTIQDYQGQKLTFNDSD